MLEAEGKNICHQPTLPKECCAYCTGNGPRPLSELCLDYITKNLETLCTCDTSTEISTLRLRDQIILPAELCDRLLHCQTSLNTKFIHIFQDTIATRLRRVKLMNIDIDDYGLCVLLNHNLTTLEIENCPKLTHRTLNFIVHYGRSLVSLTIGKDTNIITEHFSMFLEVPDFANQYLNFPPRLKRLSLRTASIVPPAIFMHILQSVPELTHLDLSNCSDLGDFFYVQSLTNLQSLILHNVNRIELMIPHICTLKNLRDLDISQSRLQNGKFEDRKILEYVVKSLPRLMALDISGTNLAGTGVAELSSDVCTSDIVGLSSRVKNPFQFLGLYETQKDACYRHDIPALLVSGNAKEEQMLVAAEAYMDRPAVLQRVLNDIFQLFRNGSCKYFGQALKVVLGAMYKYVNDKHIQISGSASLFHIVKAVGQQSQYQTALKRKVITALLNGMSAHRNDDTMMRNGCLTLCQFKVPIDVVYDYERLVELLLHAVSGMPQESFVQRIGIYLLNTVACQVDGQQKIRLGQLGTVNKMLWLIADRLKRGICDDVMAVAWSTMWNVTDETPLNCKIFLEHKGMEYFLECLKKFRNVEELLRNMMGLLGNVAEVPSLRSNFMKTEYITVFSQLLDSTCDGIEVSYNAAGVIAHIASDGPEAWTIEEPSRDKVLARMTSAIKRWRRESQRNINYRSFEPILYLIKVNHTPVCQYWAVWALANLTSVYPEKYCHVLEKEGGDRILQSLMEHPAVPKHILRLSRIVLKNCRRQHKKEAKESLQLTLDG